MMKSIFPRQYNMIFELGRLEKLMLSYPDLLRKLSLIIRNKVWDKADIKRLAMVLNACNQVFEVLVESVGDQIEFLEMYVEYLNKHSSVYSKYDLSNEYNTVKAQIQIFKTQELVKEHWKQINPYFRKEYAREDLLSKDLTEILDDFFDNVVKICPEVFLLSMNDEKFKHLSRGRRGAWKQRKDLAAPSIEVAEEHNIINRWNPPSKRYLYMVAGDGSENDMETACEEMRVKPDEVLTIAKFHYMGDPKDALILDLDYEDVTRQEIFDFAEMYEKEQVKEIISRIHSEEISITKEEIAHQVKLREDKTIWLANAFVGKLLLKEICDAIFVPLDEKEDNDKDEKDKCYKSFHILAEYLEKRGYQGISYPSTRMKLIGKKGRNLVLFDADSAEAEEDTFNTFTKR